MRRVPEPRPGSWIVPSGVTRQFTLLTTQALPCVDRGPQFLQLRVQLDRRDRDRGVAEEFPVALVQVVGHFFDRPAGDLHLAQEPQRDRAVGLNDDRTLHVVAGQRFDRDFVADRQLIGGRAGNGRTKDKAQPVADA